jgi:hypothetical protein
MKDLTTDLPLLAAGVEARSAALQLLLGDGQQSAAAARVFEEQLGWMAAIEVCSDWGALPTLRRQLDDLGVRFPAGVRDKFRHRANAVFLRSASTLREGVRALAALSDAGIDAVAFKGVAAIVSLYDGAQDRTLGDADLLVARDSLEDAVRALENAGFGRGTERSLDDHIEFIREYPGGSEFVYMVAANGSEIDLHWQLGRVPVAGVLAAAGTATAYGTRIRTVSRTHGFLLCVHHMLRNGFELDRSLRDLIDARRWLHALNQHGETAVVIDDAAEWGLMAPSLAAVRVLSRLDRAPVLQAWAAAFSERASVAERREADALAEWLLLQRGGERWNLDLLRTLDGRRLLRFVRRTLRSAYTPDASNTGVYEVPPLGVRLRRFGRALPRTRWRLLLALKKAQDRAFAPDV